MFEKQVHDIRTTLAGGSTTSQHGDATTTWRFDTTGAIIEISIKTFYNNKELEHKFVQRSQRLAFLESLMLQVPNIRILESCTIFRNLYASYLFLYWCNLIKFSRHMTHLVDNSMVYTIVRRRASIVKWFWRIHWGIHSMYRV